jgi:uncharacterized repeat protein (TIGR01451 family)
VLAAGLIRDDLQAHLALARVGEQPPSSTPTSLPVRTTRDSYDSKDDASTATTWARAYLKLLQTADRDTIAAGDNSQLKLKVVNPTAARIHNVAVCERLPLGLAYVRSSVRLHLRDGRFCWNIGTLAGHRSDTIVLVVRGLSGPQRTVKARAAADGAGVRTVRAAQRVRVVPAPLPGEAEVTG